MIDQNQFFFVFIKFIASCVAEKFLRTVIKSENKKKI